jgi:hypothetical protein
MCNPMKRKVMLYDHVCLKKRGNPKITNFFGQIIVISYSLGGKEGWENTRELLLD